MPELTTLGGPIKATYEAEPNTNAFTDPEKAKLAEAIERSLIGANGGVAPLDNSGLVPLQHLNVSGLSFLGAWDASTNTPALIDGSGSVGNFYKVSVGGTYNFGSAAYTFVPGDWVMYAAGTWQRIGVHEAVASVNGQTGMVNLTAAHVGALPSTYTPPAPEWNSVTGKPDFNALYAKKGRGGISAPIQAAYVWSNVPTSVPSATNTNMVPNTFVYDYFSMLSDGELTIPSWARRVRVTGGFFFDTNPTGYRYVGIMMGGTAIIGLRSQAVAGTATTVSIVSPVWTVTGGEKLSVVLYQNSGDTLNVSTSSWINVELFENN